MYCTGSSRCIAVSAWFDLPLSKPYLVAALVVCLAAASILSGNPRASPRYKNLPTLPARGHPIVLFSRAIVCRGIYDADHDDETAAACLLGLVGFLSAQVLYSGGVCRSQQRMWLWYSLWCRTRCLFPFFIYLSVLETLCDFKCVTCLVECEGPPIMDTGGHMKGLPFFVFFIELIGVFCVCYVGLFIIIIFFPVFATSSFWENDYSRMSCTSTPSQGRYQQTRS